MAGPFKLKSGNTPLFKSLGGSPVKDTNPHTGKGGHTHTSKTYSTKFEEIGSGAIEITSTGVGTTTKPATVVPGKKDPYVGPKMPNKDWLEFLKTPEGIAYTKKHGEKTIPETVTTEETTTKEVVEQPVREGRYRYETIHSYKDFGGGTTWGHEKPIVVTGLIGEHHQRKRMSQAEYDAFIKEEGWTQDPNERGRLRRRSTTGKGTLYNPELLDLSEKKDFDYSGIDYKDPTGRQFKTNKERDEYYKYQELLKKAQSQKELMKKYPKKIFPFMEADVKAKKEADIKAKETKETKETEE